VIAMGSVFNARTINTKKITTIRPLIEAAEEAMISSNDKENRGILSTMY
jgi:hypothetical protein